MVTSGCSGRVVRGIPGKRHCTDATGWSNWVSRSSFLARSCSSLRLPTCVSAMRGRQGQRNYRRRRWPPCSISSCTNPPHRCTSMSGRRSWGTRPWRWPRSAMNWWLRAKWIKWALDQADRCDPLKKSPPSILDNPRPTIPYNLKWW